MGRLIGVWKRRAHSDATLKRVVRRFMQCHNVALARECFRAMLSAASEFRALERCAEDAMSLRRYAYKLACELRRFQNIHVL